MRQLYVVFLSLLASVSCLTFSNWSSLSSRYDSAFLAQRDISGSVTVDQLNYLGLSLNSLLFDVNGYTNSSLDSISNLLTLKFGVFMLDLYWNTFTEKWQLCPAPFPKNDTIDVYNSVYVSWNGNEYLCQPSFTIDQLMATVKNYFADSNNQVKANLVQFAFILHAISYNENSSTNNSSIYTNSTGTMSSSLVPEEYQSYGQDYLALGNDTLAGSLYVLESYLFTPLDLETYNSKNSPSNYSYPTQKEFYSTYYKRAMALVLGSDVSFQDSNYTITQNDNNTLYFPTTSYYTPLIESSTNSSFSQRITDLYYSEDVDYSDLTKNTQFRFLIDNDEVPLTNETINKYIKSGFSPVVNSSSFYSSQEIESGSSNYTDILAMANEYSPLSFWSWAPDDIWELASSESALSKQKTIASNAQWFVASDTQIAYKCVSMTKDGWSLQNCYDKMRWACKNNSNSYAWEISSSIGTYFDLDSSCPKGYSAGVPKSSIEQFSLISLLKSKNISYPLWIDLNDITISGCYVTGGPFALCPYKKGVTTRNIIKSLMPSAIVSLFLIFLIFGERFLVFKPIHSNRKRYWKRAIQDYYKEHDYEGVPS